MSCGACTTTGGLGGYGGPGLNAGNWTALGWLPSSRVRLLTPAALASR